MIIDTWRNPYDTGCYLIRPRQIQINEGLTVLVGCNGSGKSTLISNIKQHCKDNNIPVLQYDNLNDGGTSKANEFMMNGDYGTFSEILSSSEGEVIKINLGMVVAKIKSFFKNGYVNDRSNRLSELLQDKDIIEKKHETLRSCNDRVLLLDAVDSGMSVDAIVEVKDLFELILKDAKSLDKNIYIIISANEYELARNVDCFDVNKGKYLRFKDYEDYRNFILNSREIKDKRIEKENLKRKE